MKIHEERGAWSVRREAWKNAPRLTRLLLWLCFGTAFLNSPLPVHGHPVARKNYDRTIVVRVTQSGVIVDYRLDLDEYTLVYVDVPALIRKSELVRLTTQKEFHEAFLKAYAPILAANLTALADGRKQLEFECINSQQRTRDDNGQALDHLRFDFRFQARWPDDFTGKHQLDFREESYEFEDGLIALSLQIEQPVRQVHKVEPDTILHQRRRQDLAPREDDKRRRASATFILLGTTSQSDAVAAEQEVNPERTSLLSLVQDPGRGLWILLCLAFGFGAAHALTPGHGKTLVAAYLVGERGTVWHALVLGLVTTFTHTGTVIALAGGLLVLYPDTVPDDIRKTLGLVSGLLVAGMGFWLFLRRAGGQADHLHLGGHGHHHHAHEHHLHSDVGREAWSVIVLGISGGLIPCWDAIAMFGFAISSERRWLALELLLAFSAGLAAVLIVIGILIVRLKSFASSRWESNRLFRALPLISAFTVTLMGLWLCYESVH